MTIDDLVADGWNDHATDTVGVFERFDAGIPLASERKHLLPLATLVLHVGAEHLGRFDETLALLGRIEALPAFDLGSPEGKAVRRCAAVVHRCRGDIAASERAMTAGRNPAVPEGSERVRLHAVAATTFLGQRRVAEARAELDAAVAAAAYGPTAADPASRALAVACNNMASELETRRPRTDEETALMVRCAEQALVAWRVAGGPCEEGRAEYRLACSVLEAGRAAESLAHARRCLAVFTTLWTGDAPADPVDVLFAYEAAAKAHLALGERPAASESLESAKALLPRVADDSFREFCAGELAKIEI